MTEVKTAFKRMAFMSLLIVPVVLNDNNIIPRVFMLNHFVSIYLIILSVIFIRYVYETVAGRGIMKRILVAIGVLMMIWFMARFAKYKLFHEAETIKRFCWYLYYLPMLTIPTLTFYSASCMDDIESVYVSKAFRWMMGVNFVLVGLVLTNDFHQLIFRFNPGFHNWDTDYSYTFLLYVITVWEYGLYLASLVVLIIKSRVSFLKYYGWVALFPFLIYLPVVVLDLLAPSLGIPWVKNPDVTVILVLMIATYIDTCLTLGLIPNNRGHNEIFRITSLSAQIVKKDRTVVYRSQSAGDIDYEIYDRLTSGNEEKVVVGDSVIRIARIRNGYGLWEEDISEINHINAELLDIQERLKEEGELARLDNELKKKQIKIESKTRLYDRISEETRYQSDKIYELTDKANKLTDVNEMSNILRRICIYGAYIKRYANLLLLSENDELININELGLAIQETLRYLNMYGIPVDYMCDSDMKINGKRCLAVYEAFESLIENNLDKFEAVYVRIPAEGMIKIIIEGECCTTDNVPDKVRNRLGAAGIAWNSNIEDSVSYIRMTYNEEVHV